MNKKLGHRTHRGRGTLNKNDRKVLNFGKETLIDKARAYGLKITSLIAKQK